MQPFLRKIFEGINGLEFREDGAVTAMFSEEGEKVPFCTPFNPRDSLGAVERWLIECEMAMRDTLKVRGFALGALAGGPATSRTAGRRHASKPSRSTVAAVCTVAAPTCWQEARIWNGTQLLWSLSPLLRRTPSTAPSTTTRAARASTG